MPVCFYSLRSGSSEGPLVRYANVGESIFHRWECVQHCKLLYTVLYYILNKL